MKKDKITNRSRLADRMIWIGIGLGVLYWVIEAIIDVLVFHAGPLVERLFAPDPNELWMRSLVVGAIIVCSIYTQALIKRRRAEEALAEKSMYLDSILRSSTEYAIATTDLDFRITYYNPMAEQLFGYKAEEVIGKTVQEMHTREKVAPERFNQAVENILRHGEYCYSGVQERDEGARYINSRVSGIYDPNGELVGLALFSKDVTEELQAEEQLRKLSRAVEQSPATVVITDTKGSIEYVNPKFTEVTGYTPEEAIGKNPRILKSGHTPPEVYKEMWETITSGEEWRGELLNKKKSGELYWDFATIAPIKSSEGIITHFLAVKENITERKRAEEALRESEASLAEAQRIAHLGNWNWDLEKNKFCCSDEAYRILGMEPQESCPTYEAFLNAVHPDDREFVAESIDKALHEGKPYSIDHRIVLPDGSERVVHGEAEVSYDETGRPIRMAGTIHDITERKRAREALMRSEKLAAVGQLTAGVSHEILNPPQRHHRKPPHDAKQPRHP